MNIRDLEYLVAVADLKNFSKAAKLCNVGQPTLSAQIKKLEEFLGIALFERSNKKVLVTQEGEQIAFLARRIMAEVNQIKEIASSSKDPFSSKISLGAFPTIASYILPQMVSKIKQALPNIKLILHEEKTENLREMLANGTLDCAIMAMPITDDRFDYKYLFKDEFFLAVSEGHELATRQSISIEELASHQLLLLTEGHCLRDQALDLCRLDSLGEEDFKATSLETLRQMVKAGTGITLIPKTAVKTPDEGIKYIKFTTPPSRKIALVWRKISSKKLVLDKILEAIQ